ncbi:MAG: DNA-directed RNA polymerase subunit H [Thermoplasmata archaeon M9B1D]|nr:MAG: DNA-directed RNA polymerase subunit H [Thermoplasmata archaeon M9B1D]PNX51754.1 MAG: DNA-directed RNA polymerase subunit H [Thermoplasmata archaeon M8B2D]
MAKEIEKQQFDIMNHDLVPLHIIVSDDEKNELFNKYNITPDQLPKILDSDPVSISIGAKPGQIVKIIRKSHTAKEAVAYRFVIESNE